MPDYRAFILKQDGHVDRAISFVCPDDEAARSHARLLVADEDVELWQLDRKVETFRARRQQV